MLEEGEGDEVKISGNRGGESRGQFREREGRAEGRGGMRRTERRADRGAEVLFGISMRPGKGRGEDRGKV